MAAPTSPRLLVGTVAFVLIAACVWWAMRTGALEPQALRAAIEGRGLVGVLAFVALFVALTSVFVPDTLLALVAGAIWGPVGGTAVVTAGSVLGALLQYGLARRWLHDHVTHALLDRPRLAATAAAVRQEGYRLQLLLRLTPVNPPSVSYALGAAGVPVGPFTLALVGLVPAFAVEVWVGHVARRVAAGEAVASGPVAEIALLVGLGAAVLLLLLVGRRAWRAVAARQETSSL